ncbi:hypothetical protein LLEC1_01083 [Akanthomyces lecanii]|uniref:Kynurenine formamidase n=1 Tax=Cordyceps confragosa TaxID=2714763 RepID=A0A179ICR5_CORDF|nr:hypothetical protein LLEC1_01083 [Akanthomyces lecanii]
MSSEASEQMRHLKFVQHQYRDHDLQRLGVWKRPACVDSLSSKYWVVFIHGGAWRDPRNTFEDFAPCVEYMQSSADPALSSICGFVSIDHRLSPHPEFPQDPAATTRHALRHARHPDHIADVYSALAFVQREYDIEGNYILVGHSSRAPIACQLLIGHAALHGHVTDTLLHLPAAIVGIYGIYDLGGLNDRYGDDYAGFLEGAFGTDRKVWQQISPSCFPGDLKAAGKTARRSGRALYTILAGSPDDTLLDSAEVEVMKAKLTKDAVEVESMNLVGDHDFVWKEASQVARLVSQCVKTLEAQQPDTGK